MQKTKALLMAICMTIPFTTMAQDNQVMPPVKMAMADKMKDVVPKVIDLNDKKEFDPTTQVGKTEPTLVNGEIVLQNANTNTLPKVEEKVTIPLTEGVKRANEEIRELITHFASAINAGDNEKLALLTRDGLVVIDSSQSFATKKANVVEYFPTKFGGEYKFSRTSVSIDPGVTVEVSNDGSWATVYGVGEQKVKVNDVDHTMQTRWSAVVVKQQPGNIWKVHSYQEGVNFTDNSFVNSFKDFAFKMGYVGGVVGLLLGFLIGILIGRASKKKE